MNGVHGPSYELSIDIDEVEAAIRYLLYEVNGGGEVLRRHLYPAWDLMDDKTLQMAQDQTPVLSGDLRRSGHAFTEWVGKEEDLVHSDIGFGDRLTEEYAELQHETVHFAHPRGGVHHFLEGFPHSAGTRITPEWDGVLETAINDASRELDMKTSSEHL